MFAIVDVSHRESRGQILMLVDDQETAMTMSRELAKRSVAVVVRPLSAEEADKARGVRGVHAVA